ncbi:ankyrin repeat-containing domain protein [Aspergillus heterothallicus]
MTRKPSPFGSLQFVGAAVGIRIPQLALEVICDDHGQFRDSINLVTYIFNFGHKMNKATVMTMLKDSTFDLSKADESGQTLLHKALIHNNEGVGQLLLELCIGVNATDNDGRTALYYAADNQDAKRVRMLLAAGSTPHADELKNSPLLACLFGESSFISQSWTPADEVLTAMRDIVHQLIQHGVDPNQFFKQRAIIHELLSNQALSNSVYAVEILLDRGADPNLKDAAGMAPLHYAAPNGDIRTVSCLLFGGANLNMKNKQGSTAVQLAEQHGLSLVWICFLERKPG